MLLLDASQRAADDLLERVPVLADADAAGLEARHVEEIVNQAIQAIGLLLDHLGQLAPRGRVEPRLLLDQRAGRAGDRRQRRAQVVGDRAEQGAPEPLRLGPEAGLLGFVHQRHALDGEGRLRGEGLEEVELLGCGRGLVRRRLDAEDPHRAARGGEREIERSRAGERGAAATSHLPVLLHPLRDVRARWPRRSPAPAHPHGGRAAHRDRGETPRCGSRTPPRCGASPRGAARPAPAG